MLNRPPEFNKPMTHPVTNKQQPRVYAQPTTPSSALVHKPLYSFLMLFIAAALFLAYASFLCSTTLHNVVRPVLNSSFLSDRFTALPSLETLCALSPDLDYINALVEQDSVANLRYGLLFLLALSSLGVYSIILAG